MITIRRLQKNVYYVWPDNDTLLLVYYGRVLGVQYLNTRWVYFKYEADRKEWTLIQRYLFKNAAVSQNTSQRVLQEMLPVTIHTDEQ